MLRELERSKPFVCSSSTEILQIVNSVENLLDVCNRDGRREDGEVPDRLGCQYWRGDEQVVPLVQALLANYTDVLAVLIEKHFDVNAKDDYGTTSLHYAAMTDYGDTRTVQMLLAAGAKRDIKDKAA